MSLTQRLICFFLLSLLFFTGALVSPVYSAEPICTCYYNKGECDVNRGGVGYANDAQGCRELCNDGRYLRCANSPLEKCRADSDCTGGACENVFTNRIDWSNGSNQELVDRIKTQCEDADKLAKTTATKKDTPKEALRDFQKPSLFFNIPNFQFSDLFLTGPFIEISFIGEYIIAGYSLLINLAMLIAIIMTMMGGVRYIISATGSGREGAKTQIRNGITGLILVLCTYTILSLVNPALTIFRPLNLYSVPKENFDFPAVGIDGTPEGGAGKAAPCSPITESKKSEFGYPTDYDLDKYACPPRSDDKIQFIVLHEGGRPSISAKTILAGRGLSTHYAVKLDGTVIQHVGPEKSARHAGGINLYSIGIDLEGPQECGSAAKWLSSCERTDAQVQALKTLLSRLTKRYNIPYDSQHILAHCNISTNRDDPRALDFEKLGLKTSDYRDPSNPINGSCYRKDWTKTVKK